MRNLNTKGLNAPRAMVMALFLLLACFVAGRMAVTAEAASNKVTVLKQGKTYSYNLNGGKKKEKVRYTFKSVDFYPQTSGFKLYINGKKVYSFNSGDLEDAEVQLLDVNRKDKYKELLICCMGPNQNLEKVVLIRYLSGKKIKVFNCDYHAEHVNKRSSIVKNSGKNKFYVASQTPFPSETFGLYYASIPLKLLGNRLVFANTDDTYDLVAPHWWPELNYKKNKYTLSRSMTLYSSASRNKQIGTLPSGTSFTASKIRPAGSKIVSWYDNIKVKYYDLFVKIKTVSGRIGWLFPRIPRCALPQIQAWVGLILGRALLTSLSFWKRYGTQPYRLKMD